MEEVITKVLVSLLVAALTALGGWLIRQIVKYKNLVKQEEDSNILKSFNKALDEQLQPIKKDISKLQTVETKFQTRFKPMQEEIEHLKDDIQEILDSLKAQGLEIDNLTSREKTLEHETRCAWRYRIRQLCHAYIQRGYMYMSEYDQLREMYAIYEAIGGNGQTKELYEKTVKLDIRPGEPQK